jgi:AraC-like DNA-binding protein
MLLAVDGNQCIVGANRAARLSLVLDDRGLRSGISFWRIFEQDLDLFRRKDRTDICKRLLVAGSDDSQLVLVTPPAHNKGASRYPADIYLQTRPRLDSIEAFIKPVPVPQALGGLSAGAMRRVQEYVAVHLNESIDLTTLAAVAGLSVHHFARQFKQSAGLTPHYYLTQKRLERAQEMLTQTELSLSEIAYAASFCDQSHLARHFRHILGTTPRACHELRHPARR